MGGNRKEDDGGEWVGGGCVREEYEVGDGMGREEERNPIIVCSVTSKATEKYQRRKE